MSRRVLVIEGGGMKAAYANGVLSAFESEGFRPWDAVLGTSAGGALAAWYSAGQARYAEGTWKYAADKRILSYGRALRGGPILDHEALLEVVYQQEHPLDVRAVAKAPWPVIVTAADVDTGACVYQDIRGDDVIAWLKATGRLPAASGPPVEIRSRRYVDGGVIDPIPIRYAVEHLGADHVTLLVNKEPAPKRSDPQWLAKLVGRKYPALRSGLVQHEAIKMASFAYARNPPAGVRVDLVLPSQATGLSRLSRDLDQIQAGLELGRYDGLAYVKSQV